MTERFRSTARWSRRRVLQSVPALLASSAFPAAVANTAGPAPASPRPFSHFVDVAQAAGLTNIMSYGEGTKATYITEIMGGGCAFFDYDNDGWMDILILGGRRLESVPPGASNRLYHNNRDGTDVYKRQTRGSPGTAGSGPEKPLKCKQARAPMPGARAWAKRLEGELQGCLAHARSGRVGAGATVDFAKGGVGWSLVRSAHDNVVGSVEELETELQMCIRDRGDSGPGGSSRVHPGRRAF